jgi:hypothetical protein
MAYRRTQHPALFELACVLLSLAGSGFAQQSDHDRSCTVDAAAIFTTPEGNDRSNFNHGGWGFQAGLGVGPKTQKDPSHGYTWYIAGNYLYDKFRVRKSALEAVIAKDPQFAGATSGHGNFSSVTLDPTFRWSLNRHSSLYWSGGFGWLRRGVGLNGASGVPLLLPGSSSLGGASSNSGVFDFGMGINYAPRSFRGLMLFTEGRVYHGTAINTGATLVPVSVGVRW